MCSPGELKEEPMQRHGVVKEMVVFREASHDLWYYHMTNSVYIRARWGVGREGQIRQAQSWKLGPIIQGSFMACWSVDTRKPSEICGKISALDIQFLIFVQHIEILFNSIRHVLQFPPDPQLNLRKTIKPLWGLQWQCLHLKSTDRRQGDGCFIIRCNHQTPASWKMLAGALVMLLELISDHALILSPLWRKAQYVCRTLSTRPFRETPSSPLN